MYQLYCFFAVDNKWTEEFDTYQEVCDRIVEMKPELEALDSYLLIVNNPSGTQIQTVSK